MWCKYKSCHFQGHSSLLFLLYLSKSPASFLKHSLSTLRFSKPIFYIGFRALVPKCRPTYTGTPVSLLGGAAVYLLTCRFDFCHSWNSIRSQHPLSKRDWVGHINRWKPRQSLLKLRVRGRAKHQAKHKGNLYIYQIICEVGLTSL